MTDVSKTFRPTKPLLRDMARAGKILERMIPGNSFGGFYLRWNMDADEPIDTIQNSYHGTYGTPEDKGGHPKGRYVEILYSIEGNPRGTFNLWARCHSLKVRLSDDFGSPNSTPEFAEEFRRALRPARSKPPREDQTLIKYLGDEELAKARVLCDRLLGPSEWNHLSVQGKMSFVERVRQGQG